MEDLKVCGVDLEKLKELADGGDEKAAKIVLEYDKEQRKRDFRAKLLNEEV